MIHTSLSVLFSNYIEAFQSRIDPPETGPSPHLRARILHTIKIDSWNRFFCSYGRHHAREPSAMPPVARRTCKTMNTFPPLPETRLTWFLAQMKAYASGLCKFMVWRPRCEGIGPNSRPVVDGLQSVCTLRGFWRSSKNMQEIQV